MKESKEGFLINFPTKAAALVVIGCIALFGCKGLAASTATPELALTQPRVTEVFATPGPEVANTQEAKEVSLAGTVDEVAWRWPSQEGVAPLLGYLDAGGVGVADLDAGIAHKLFSSPQGTSDRGLAWSGDGSLAFVREAKLWKQQICILPGVTLTGFDMSFRCHDAGNFVHLSHLSWSPGNWFQGERYPGERRLAFIETDRNSNESRLCIGRAGDPLDYRCEVHEGATGPITWSPEEGDKFVAFPVAEADGSQQIYILLVGTGEYKAEPHTDMGFNCDPAWSPRGPRVAFVSGQGCEGSLKLLTFDAYPPRTLVSQMSVVGPLAWSPDGRFIAFAGKTEPEAQNQQIFIKEVYGSQQLLQLTDSEANNRFPVWSPDGEEIAFIANGEVYVVAASGGEPLRLTGEGR